MEEQLKRIADELKRFNDNIEEMFCDEEGNLNKTGCHLRDISESLVDTQKYWDGKKWVYKGSFTIAELLSLIHEAIR